MKTPSLKTSAGIRNRNRLFSGLPFLLAIILTFLFLRSTFSSPSVTNTSGNVPSPVNSNPDISSIGVSVGDSGGGSSNGITLAQANISATNAAHNATNNLPTGAFNPTNNYDLAGVGATAARNATNGLASGAFYPTNTFDLAGSAAGAVAAAIASGTGVSNAYTAFSNSVEPVISMVVTSSCVIVTNDQVIKSGGNFYLGQNIAAGIFLTNGQQVNIFGEGTIYSNFMANGAFANIHCRNYCTNGGQTLFNLYSNWNTSVTCVVDTVYADISDTHRSQYAGLPAGWEGGNTTNYPDLFEVNASQYVHFWQWEFKRYDNTHFLNFMAPVIHWKAPTFDASYYSSAKPAVPTLNCANGSRISADTFIAGSDASGNGEEMLLQLWNNPPYTNIIFYFDVGTLTATTNFDGPVFPIITGFYVGTNATSNQFLTSVPNGINLPRQTIDGDQLAAPYYDQEGSLWNWMNWGELSGSFFEPVESAVYTALATYPDGPVLQSSISSGVISGNAAGLTNIPASRLAGFLATNQIPLLDSNHIGSAGINLSQIVPQPAVTSPQWNAPVSSTMNNIINTASGGRATDWIQIQFNGSASGIPTAQVQIPGLFTNIYTVPLASGMAVNTYSVPIQPGFTNTVVDVSTGSGASIKVLRQTILQ